MYNSMPSYSKGLPTDNSRLSFNFNKLFDAITSSRTAWDFGSGMHNFQYHAFDELNRHLYTLQHSTSNDKGGKISRFAMDTEGNKVHVIDSQMFDTNIGHQMLSVENVGDKVKLWTAKGIQESLSVIRFDYTPHGSPQNIQEFILFDPDIFDEVYLTGNLSFDKKYLIARGKSKKESIYKGYNCLSIFEIERLLQQKEGKSWHLADTTWPYDYYLNNKKNTSINPQSIISWNGVIYIFFGPIDINKPNIFRAYTYDGKLLYESPEISLGKGFNKNNQRANEIEGAQFIRTSSGKTSLTIGYVKGGDELQKGIYISPPFLF